MRLRTKSLLLLLISICTYSTAVAQCYDEDLVVDGAICTLIYQPVCGCNGVTYSNPCVAEKFAGISTYTLGVCQEKYYTVTNPDYFDMGYVYTEGGPEGAVLLEDRSLFTVVSDDASAKLTISENYGSAGITKLVINPQGLAFQEPLAIAAGAPVDIASLKKVGGEHQLYLSKDDLQTSLSISPTSLNYSNATNSNNSFGIDFANNSMNIGNLDIINLGSNKLGLKGDIVRANSTLYDLGNNIAGEQWDDVVANRFVVFSDRRLKNNIKSLEYGLSAVMKLKPVQYKYDTAIDASGEERLGFIAQDVKKVVPHVVQDADMEMTEDGKTYKKVKREHLSMSYQDLIPVLTKAIQEQQSQIAILTTELAAVKQQLAEK